MQSDVMYNIKHKLWESLQQEVANRHCVFVLTEDIKKTLKFASQWIYDITQDGTKKFWFILSGGCGNGKTTIAKAMAATISSITLNDSRLQGSLQGCPLRTSKKLSEYAIDKDPDISSIYREYCRNYQVIVLDDLGEEEETAKSFGNLKHPMRDLLTERYEKMMPIIITTNLEDKDLAVRYGERVADRLMEVSTFVTLKDKSFRQ